MSLMYDNHSDGMQQQQQLTDTDINLQVSKVCACTTVLPLASRHLGLLPHCPYAVRISLRFILSLACPCCLDIKSFSLTFMLWLSYI
jgi:hypothetical protein